MNNSSKAILVYNKKILFLLRDNVPTIPEPNKWHLPGGKVEPGETFDEAIRRELKEEIHVVPNELVYLGLFKREDSDHAVYFSRLTKNEYQDLKLGDEGQDMKFFDSKGITQIELVNDIAQVLPIITPYITDVIEKEEIPIPQKLGLLLE